MDSHLLRFDNSKRLCFIDLETYNLCLSFLVNKPWQVGIIDVCGNEVLDKLNLHVKWPNPPKMSEQAAKITRFKPEVLDNVGITPEKAFGLMYNSLESCDWIIGHNIIGFDLHLIKEWYLLNNKPWEHLINKSIDTNCLAKGIKLGVPYQVGTSLVEYQLRLYHRIERGVKTRTEVLGKEFGIEHDYANLHDAIVDLELLIKIWNHLKKMVEI